MQYGLIGGRLGHSYSVEIHAAAADYEYEESMARINHRLNPALETLYLRADDDVLSSSMVRELLAFGKDVGDCVPAAVAKLL